jgi:GntR family transcriptional regulator, transcriptional repressor for pyruvate dehydrogenase complex
VSATAPELRFDPIEQVRAHEYVAEQVRRQLVLRLVAPGDSLPPERELARMFAVGRATVQRAIALLEAEGLVERRRGRSGGTFARETPSGQRGLERILAQMRKNRRLIEEALTFRLEIEPAAAGLAARERKEVDVARIQNASRRAAKAPTDAGFMQHDTDFHLAVGRATRNRFYLTEIEQLRIVLDGPLVALPDSELWHDRSNKEHDAIVRAIEDGDERAARAAMRLHVEHTDRSIKALLHAL